jgi:hypothetical protein
MMTLLSAAFLLHGGDIPHVHPHDAAVALAITLALAFVAGALHALLRRNRPA